MSFQNLKVDELKEVAEFFAVDVEAADEEKGATKKELLASLAAGEDPVTWDQYKDIYLVAQNDPKPADPVLPEVVKEEKVAKPVDRAEPPVISSDDDEEVGNNVLVKYERQNPTYEIVGYHFSVKHPFKSVPPEVAEHLIRNAQGFRLALPSEALDFYN